MLDLQFGVSFLLFSFYVLVLFLGLSLLLFFWEGFFFFLLCFSSGLDGFSA